MKIDRTVTEEVTLTLSSMEFDVVYTHLMRGTKLEDYCNSESDEHIPGFDQANKDMQSQLFPIQEKRKAGGVTALPEQ